jgi:dTMP kinase
VASVHGRLIAFEGIDGCGKTTQAELLFERIGEPAALSTSEPGATPLGARLRRLLLDPELPSISPDAEALLLAADRAEHVAEVLVPALAMGRWVVTDRYSGSTLAYQGYGRGIDLAELERLVHFATGGLEADLNVLIDVPVEVAKRRIGALSPDRLESLDEAFHERVAAGYRRLSEDDPSHWAVVDGTGEVDEVARLVHLVVDDRLGPLPFSQTDSASSAGPSAAP